MNECCVENDENRLELSVPDLSVRIDHLAPMTKNLTLKIEFYPKMLMQIRNLQAKVD